MTADQPTGSRPNILILMADQLSGVWFPDGPAPFLHAPNLRALAEWSARFANAYTASPLCAPARAALRKFSRWSVPTARSFAMFSGRTPFFSPSASV